MLELAFDSGVADPDVAVLERARLEGALAAALAAEGGGAAAGVAALLAAIGLRPGLMNESYFAEALAFHLAQTYAHLGRSKEMVDCIERSGTLPADGGDLLYPDHVARSLGLFEHREAARVRGVPAFLIASMPRAASTSLTQSLARSLDMPVLRVSLGHFPHCMLAPSWLNSASPGGAVLHDHFGATPENLATLRSCGVSEVFVLVRDPRAASASVVDFGTSRFDQPIDDAQWTANVLDTYRHLFIPWLEGWIAEANTGDLRVRWIQSRLVRTDLHLVWREMLSALAPLYPSLNSKLDLPPAEVRVNFVHGLDDLWRCRVGERVREEMWAALSPAAIELLELEP